MEGDNIMSIEKIRQIESQLKKLQKELSILHSISEIEPQNERETIIKLYLLGTSLVEIYSSYKANGIKKIEPYGLYPDTANLKKIIYAEPSGQITQDMINLAKDYFDENARYPNRISVSIPKDEKLRYLKHYSRIGYKTMDDFVRKALRLQFALDLANIQNDEDLW